MREWKKATLLYILIQDFFTAAAHGPPPGLERTSKMCSILEEINDPLKYFDPMCLESSHATATKEERNSIILPDIIL